MTPRLTPKQISHNTSLLIDASEAGNTDEVKRLIPVSDPKAQSSNALQWAARKGYSDIVELLIPVSDPKERESQALQLAAIYGHIDAVKLLIPVSEPKVQNSQALLWAAKYGHTEIVKLLLPVSNFNSAREYMQEKNQDTILLQQCIDEYEALQQKQLLTNKLNQAVGNTNQSVKRKM